MHTSRHRALAALCAVAVLEFGVSADVLTQERISAQGDTAKSEVAQAAGRASVQVATSEAVQFPQLRERLTLMVGGIFLFGGLALLVDRLRRRADEKAGLG